MRTLLIVLLAILAHCAATADTLPRVSFVSFYPGEEIYELDGHSGLRIHSDNSDICISYGVFDFNAPNFVYRFVKGETDYMVGAAPFSDFFAEYALQGRRVVEHTIDLDSLQTMRLMALLNENFLPQNRVYRYNYVLDNCATRPLHMLELAIGEEIILPDADEPFAEKQTFRSIMRTDHKNYPWYQFGIDLALGSGIDRPISDREKSFSPVVLDTQLSKARTPSGRKLVKSSQVLNEGTDNAIEPPTPWFLTPTFVFWLLFAAACVLTVRDVRRGRVTRWFDAAFYFILGCVGCVLTFLIFVSVHEATSPNWLYLFFNPAALLVPIFIWLKKCKTLVFCYQIVNFAVIIVGAAIWPLTGQALNLALIPVLATDAMRSASYIFISYRRNKAV